MWCVLRISLAIMAIAGSAQAGTTLSRYIPADLSSYVEALDRECQAMDLGHAVANDNYTLANPGADDVNGDGRRDYFMYRCMFGCSRNPDVFMGTGTPCPSGTLLLSDSRSIFIPGRVTAVAPGRSLRVVVKRPRALRLKGNYCHDPFPQSDPGYVYELRGDGLRLVGPCPPSGCSLVLNTSAWTR